MTADLYDLFFTLELESRTLSEVVGSRPTTPKDLHVQGRSRRRVNRHKHKHHRSSLSISSDSSDSGNEDAEEEGTANRTLKAEVSFVEESLDDRVHRQTRELDDAVRVIQEGLIHLSTVEGGEGEVDNWHMLSFALQDWQ